MQKKILKNMQAISMFTIILTTVLTLSGAYSLFGARLKEEIKSCAVILADVANNSDEPLDVLKSLNNINGQHMSLFGSDGRLIFESEDKIRAEQSDYPEIREAINNGTGETMQYYSRLGAQVYAYAIRLNDGSVIRVAGTMHSLLKIFGYLALPVVFVFGLLFILCLVISRILTDNIIQPINRISLTDFDDGTEIYPELAPFINKIKAQNNEISRQLVKLKTRKTRFQTVSENINEGLLTFDADCEILSMNKSAERIFGATEDSVLHTDFALVADCRELVDALHEAQAGNNKFITVHLGQRAYNAFYSPVFENGKVRGIVMLMLDITEKEETEEIRKEFTANVSHELKTPLTTILGYSQIINRGIAKPEDINGFTEKIEKEAARLITLIDDIIKLSCLDEGVTVGETQSVHMLTVVHDVCDGLQVNAAGRNISIDIDGDDFTVDGNLMQITELVYNICDNAIKYNKQDGSVKIRLHGRSLTVSDTGIGIPDEYRERIFERFFRVDKSRSKSVNGTGLGLSIVKHIAECYGAKLEVESTLGKGTSITVEF